MVFERKNINTKKRYILKVGNTYVKEIDFNGITTFTCTDKKEEAKKIYGWWLFDTYHLLINDSMTKTMEEII